MANCPRCSHAMKTKKDVEYCKCGFERSTLPQEGDAITSTHSMEKLQTKKKK